ncbi:MAG: hypothetical protein U9P80_00925 [Thermodesulfobacteriota bacterium]|nr:hypothetical protein [Thermodesulfobacteriota bacterium]
MGSRSFICGVSVEKREAMAAVYGAGMMTGAAGRCRQDKSLPKGTAKAGACVQQTMSLRHSDDVSECIKK